MTPDCKRYIEDPEANASHLTTCAECAALFAAPAPHAPDAAAPLTLDRLPLAPWEGASHRPWALILGIALAVLAVAAALFSLVGLDPLRAAIARVPSLDFLMTVARLAGGAAQHAPPGWQGVAVVGVVIVNTLLVALLRRAPRGLDV